MPIIASCANPTAINPETLYSYPEFIRCSGLSYTRIRQAGRDGLEIPTIACGRRKFIRGRDAIDFIERLAVHYSKPSGA